jgi:hypothetical protein
MTTAYIPNNIRTAQAVYKVSDANGTPIFVGCCKLTEVYYLRPLVKNPAFDATQAYSVEVLAITQNKVQAYNLMSAHIKSTFGDKLPFFIVTAYHNLHGTIICEQTGEVFYRQSDICRKLDCTAAQLSNHLRGVAGYNSVRGMTFKRADFTAQNMQVQKSERVATKPMYKADIKTRQPIVCDQTGRVFASQLEASKALGVNKAQLSQHLRRAKGYNTIKGMTFSHVPAAPAVPSPVQEVRYP